MEEAPKTGVDKDKGIMDVHRVEAIFFIVFLSSQHQHPLVYRNIPLESYINQRVFIDQVNPRTFARRKKEISKSDKIT